MDKVEKTKLIKSRHLVATLQNLFARMILSNVKYQNPIDVLESIVTDQGEELDIFEQKDIGEFFITLLERLQEGLGENKQLMRKLISDDLQR